MAARKTQTIVTPPTLPPERAYQAIKKQLDALQLLKGKNYHDAEYEEDEWKHLTQSIIEHSFGNPSSNLDKFLRARTAGSYFMVPYGGDVPHAQNQSNFEARI